MSVSPTFLTVFKGADASSMMATCFFVSAPSSFFSSFFSSFSLYLSLSVNNSREGICQIGFTAAKENREGQVAIRFSQSRREDMN